ncbi:2'-5'-oligoadenylate synthase 3-like isoform X3 [Dendronephthya gigantea]|uniref:2'-5'-oligoadenylate synthase 3-like isoform X3 n=1 Tax=Dendronephthya gigantea TaxID=151771 RepID=UPI00106D0A2E|nr:2'-5'-oligoadenylate synthase 3-like isoform X3 [Dendronephthya gigantea]XP_028407256.1 2'-5'-oligoadenylate synthase 3-like isoform X3 [Dendronephthya gigantea]
MEFSCGVCRKSFTNRLIKDLHEANCTGNERDETASASAVSPSGSPNGNNSRATLDVGGLLVGGLVGGALLAGAVYKVVKAMALNEGSTDTVDFRSPVNVKDLNRFIAENLQPTDEFKVEMGRAIDKICRFLHQEMRPDQIVKGGSLGKGTAVKGECDIDLVLVLNEVEDAEELKENLPTIVDDVIGKLRQNRAELAIIPNSLKNARFLVKFSVQGEHGKIDVDLLPTFKVRDLQSLYRKMKTDTHNKEYYSVALAKQKVDFVENRPPNVKSLIRLVKYWKKKMVRAFSSDRRIPNSYLMELIIIHLWEENTSGYGRFNTLKAFHGIMKTLDEYQSLNVIWTDNYRINDIPYHVRCTRPLVMDPANPMNNVCKRFVWEEISIAAREVLESQMMNGVSSDSWI